MATVATTIFEVLIVLYMLAIIVYWAIGAWAEYTIQAYPLRDLELACRYITTVGMFLTAMFASLVARSVIQSSLRSWVYQAAPNTFLSKLLFYIFGTIQVLAHYILVGIMLFGYYVSANKPHQSGNPANDLQYESVYGTWFGPGYKKWAWELTPNPNFLFYFWPHVAVWFIESALMIVSLWVPDRRLRIDTEDDKPKEKKNA